MVSFVRKGLVSLKTQSIQMVKVYGQKIGEKAPIWIQEFEISDSESRVLTALGSATNLPIRPSSVGDFTDKSIAPKAPRSNLKNAVRKFSFRFRSRVDRILAIAEQATSQNQLSNARFSRKVSSSKYLTALLIATLPAFLLGAIVAVVSSLTQGGSSQTGAVPQSADSISANQIANSSNANQDQSKPQVEVKQYLDKMNKAQRNFYLKNGRFASSLEELERSAAVISLLTQSHNYTYKLSILGGTQSQLSATPKEDGLNSFIGVVVVTKAENDKSTAVTTTCESSQPSKLRPLIAPSKGNQIQCPAGTTKIL
jgi:hypothetical protein